MNKAANSILAHLHTVNVERRRRAASPEIASRVHALKAYQQQRFAKTYADMLASPRYRGASKFFLEELYGPRDFSRRDASSPG
jgi:hypothetical protein